MALSGFGHGFEVSKNWLMPTKDLSVFALSSCTENFSDAQSRVLQVTLLHAMLV